MKDDMINALMVWGDRSNRDTAHLLDIAIAGTIEQTIGHGTVILRPARLEEIVSRIAPRERDADGGWKVTLLPDPAVPMGPLPAINIRCETTSDGVTGTTSLKVIRVEAEDDGSLTAVTDHWPEQTSEEIAHLAAQVLRMEKLPGENRNTVTAARYNALLEDAKRLAGSALTQRG